MLSHSDDNQSEVIEAFNSNSQYHDDLLNIDNNFFDNMVNPMYHSEVLRYRGLIFGFKLIFIEWFF